MPKRVCITGIAGFIGSHLADELVAHDYDVCGIDNLDPQVHGPGGHLPTYLNPAIQFLKGDICESVVERLFPVDAVIHLAAKVGVAQSMYQMSDYTWHNTYGTSMLLQSLQKYPPKKLIVASSMSVYGEGAGVCPDDGSPCGMDHRIPVPTPETKQPDLQSIYALTKYDQERMCLLFGRAYHVPTIALRFFNVYGLRQSLNNPYTGAMAIFASRLLNGKPPIIYEDGLQSRDFVHVSDVVRGIRLALESDVSDEVINIGSGTRALILTLAEDLAKELGVDVRPQITRQHRVGDIRHCWADVSKARRLLGYEPQVSIFQGIRDYVQWLKTQPAEDNLEQHRAELREKGLLV
jgi:dTDP-L-rhamnose 4-epimerase